MRIGARGSGERHAAWPAGRVPALRDPRRGGCPMSAPVTVYVPRDSAARSVGADEVATAVRGAADRPVRVVRNGSRGMLWLEPLVEVVTGEGRIGYGPVRPEDVDGLLTAGMLDGAD